MRRTPGTRVACAASLASEESFQVSHVGDYHRDSAPAMRSHAHDLVDRGGARAHVNGVERAVEIHPIKRKLVPNVRSEIGRGNSEYAHVDGKAGTWADELAGSRTLMTCMLIKRRRDPTLDVPSERARCKRVGEQGAAEGPRHGIEHRGSEDAHRLKCGGIAREVVDRRAQGVEALPGLTALDELAEGEGLAA